MAMAFVTGTPSLLRQLCLAGLLVLAPLHAHALSEIQREELPPTQEGTNPPATPAAPQADPKAPAGEPENPAPADANATDDGAESVPMPDKPALIPTDPVDSEEGEQEAKPDNGDVPQAGRNRPKDDDIPVPAIQRDLSVLPGPVKRMRELIIEACQSGDIEKLRPLIGTGEDITNLSFGGMDSDPIEFLRATSGDSEGHEILAILLEVLEAGYVHLDAGKEEELYVWPYFFAVPLDKLSPPEKVELFKLVTAGDLEDMQSFGAYIFYRVGITPEGRWSFFVAGD